MTPFRTIVLLHGAWHGGRCYSRIARILRAKGFDVLTPTLTGLDESDRYIAATANETLSLSPKAD